MAEDGLRNIIVGLIFFVGFTIMMLTVAVNFGSEYGRDSQEIGDGGLDLSKFEAIGNTVEGNTSAMRSSFESGNVDDIDDASGMFGTIKKFVNLITAPFTLLSEIMVKVLKFPTIIVNIILGMLSVLLILGMWRVLRIGS